MTGCVYDKDHMSAVWIKNRSESDPRICEVTLALQRKLTTREAPTNCTRDTIEQIMDDFL